SSARVRRSSARIKTFSLTSATYTDALPFALTIFLQGYAPAAPGGGRCRAEIATAVELSKSGATHNDGEPVRFARQPSGPITAAPKIGARLSITPTIAAVMRMGAPVRPLVPRKTSI